MTETDKRIAALEVQVRELQKTNTLRERFFYHNIPTAFAAFWGYLIAALIARFFWS